MAAHGQGLVCKLRNLIVFLDFNGLQIDGQVECVMNVQPLPDKWQAFGWAVQEIDGHDLRAICGAVSKAKQEEQPSMIVAHTVKGKGVSFMENQAGWHGSAPSSEQVVHALKELEGR